MALMNVALELAKSKRNVLIVDFDLEAPGITTYEGFQGAGNSAGVIDYIAQYVETNEAPDVQDFIVPCTVPVDKDGNKGTISVMSAGRRNKDYAAKLAMIDWQDLYSNHSGYLMFEDLKQQWSSIAPKIDYVLIDSRTGHTDVGGICTRQLPNVVLLLYFPNDQNILGLETVVEQIREGNQRLQRKTELLFCPSNVPYLDDEFDILRKQLDHAQKALDYNSAAAVLHRYDSLSLLDQNIFVVERPRTRLAEEYRNLTQAIVRTNVGDRDGALAELNNIRHLLRDRDRVVLPASGSKVKSGPSFLKYASDRVEEIKRHHPLDGEVSLGLAIIYHALGDLANEQDALQVTIDAHYKSTEAKIRFAMCLLGQQLPDDAANILKTVASSADSSAFDFVTAIKLLKNIKPSEWLSILNISAIEKLDPKDQLIISGIIASDKQGANIARRIAENVLAMPDINPELRSQARNEIVFAFMCRQQFAEAMAIISPSKEEILKSTIIGDVFNYAMAEWGKTGSASVELLKLVISLEVQERDRDSDANFAQCLSLANYLVGNLEAAKSFLNLSRRHLGPGEVFSCWRYMNVNRVEMRKDLNAMDAMFAGASILPIFCQKRYS